MEVYKADLSFTDDYQSVIGWFEGLLGSDASFSWDGFNKVLYISTSKFDEDTFKESLDVCKSQIINYQATSTTPG